MKRFLITVIFLTLCGGAFAQISTDHRGYDIPANVKRGKAAPLAAENTAKPESAVLAAEETEETVPGALAERNSYLIFSPGIMLGNDIEFDGVKFDSSTLGHFDLSLHYYPFKYIGVGVGVSYLGNRTEKKHNVFTQGDTAAVRYNSWGVNLLAIGRYPSGDFEPYASAGVSYNFNYIARDYTDNTDAENGKSMGYLFEAGLRWFAFESAFAGASVRYTYNSQDTKNSQDVDLGGVTVFLNIGCSF